MNNWKVPVAFVLVICLPVLLAALALRQGWYESGTRNKGQWLSQERYLLEPARAHQAQWRLVYLDPKPCEGECQQIPVLMQRIQSALGRNMDKLALVQLPGTLLPEAQAELKAGDLMLVDPRGLAILRYEVPANTAAWPQLGKAVLSDLQLLLRYQRGQG